MAVPQYVKFDRGEYSAEYKGHKFQLVKVEEIERVEHDKKIIDRLVYPKWRVKYDGDSDDLRDYCAGLFNSKKNAVFKINLGIYGIIENPEINESAKKNLLKPKRRWINPGDHETPVTMPLNRAELITLLGCLLDRIEAAERKGEQVITTIELAQKLEYYLRETE